MWQASETSRGRCSSSTTPTAAGTGSSTCASGARSRRSIRHRHRLLRDRRAARPRRPVAEARQDPDPHGRRGLAPDQEGAARRGAAASRAASSIESLERDKDDEPVPRRASTRSSRRCATGRSSAASTTGTSSTPRRTSPTASSTSSARRRSSARSTSPGPGLTQNVELNIKIESSAEVAQLQEWYERHWDDAVGRHADVLRTIERHTRDVHAVRRLRAGAARAVRRQRADRERVGAAPTRRCSRCSTATSRRPTGR